MIAKRIIYIVGSGRFDFMWSSQYFAGSFLSIVDGGCAFFADAYRKKNPPFYFL